MANSYTLHERGMNPPDQPLLFALSVKERLADIRQLSVSMSRSSSLLDITSDVISKKRRRNEGVHSHTEDNSRIAHMVPEKVLLTSSIHLFETVLGKKVTSNPKKVIKISSSAHPFEMLAPKTVLSQNTVDPVEIPVADAMRLPIPSSTQSTTTTTIEIKIGDKTYTLPTPTPLPVRRKLNQTMSFADVERLRIIDERNERELDARIEYEGEILENAEEKRNDELDELIMARVKAQKTEYFARIKKRKISQKEEAKQPPKPPKPKPKKIPRYNPANPTYEYLDEEGNLVYSPVPKRFQVVLENCEVEGCGGMVYKHSRNARGLYFCDEHKKQHKRNPIKK